VGSHWLACASNRPCRLPAFFLLSRPRHQGAEARRGSSVSIRVWLLDWPVSRDSGPVDDDLEAGLRFEIIARRRHCVNTDGPARSRLVVVLEGRDRCGRSNDIEHCRVRRAPGHSRRLFVVRLSASDIRRLTVPAGSPALGCRPWGPSFAAGVENAPRNESFCGR